MNRTPCISFSRLLLIIATSHLLISSTLVESASSPFPQKIVGPILQRDDCVVPRQTGPQGFDAYIEEFLFEDTRAGLSLYSCINWSEGFLVSEGLGKSGSRRAAELVARGNALKTLLTVNLHSEADLQTYTEQHARTRISIQNVLIKNAEIQELPDDGSFARALVRIPFYGLSGLNAILLNERELFLTSPQVGPTPSEEDEISPGDDFSGIVIDVRAISDVEPALLPKVISEEGEILYDASQVNPEILRESGMIEYVRESPDLSSWRTGQNPFVVTPLLLAAASDRLRFPLLAQEQTPKRRRRGNNLVVEAGGSQGEIPVNIVVSVEDAKKIKQLNQSKQLDKQGKYTILIGGEIGGVKGQNLEILHAFQMR